MDIKLKDIQTNFILSSIFDISCWQNASLDGILSFALGVVVEDCGRALILERSVRSFLPYRCEIPNDIIDPSNDIFDSAKNIVRSQAGLEITHIKKYIKHFDYQRLDGSFTKMVVVSAVANPDQYINVNSDFRFGTFISPKEALSYNIISPFIDCLNGFWFGIATDSEFKKFLFCQAKKDGIWKCKLRLLISVKGNSGVLVLRRNRMQSFALFFEFIGADFSEYDDFETVVSDLTENMLGIKFEEEKGYIGFHDYENSDGEKVREFFFIINGKLLGEDVQMVEHSQCLFVSAEESLDLKLTSSCCSGMRLLSSWLNEKQ